MIWSEKTVEAVSSALRATMSYGHFTAEGLTNAALSLVEQSDEWKAKDAEIEACAAAEPDPCEVILHKAAATLQSAT